MKQFITRVLLFLILATVTVEFGSYILKLTGLYTYYIPGVQTHNAIRKSKLNNVGITKTLILGDSVGKQLFNNRKYNQEPNSFACIQSISMAGQYFLLKNYLDAGNKLSNLFLVVTPFTFDNNLNERFTYHYFLKPFGGKEYSDLYTETVNHQLTKVPYKYLAKSSYVQTSKWAPKFTNYDEVDFTFLSPISIEYLSKIKELSIQNNFDFTIIPTPTKISRKEQVDNFDRNEIVGLSFEKEISDYLEEIIYLDDDNFLDKVHLKSPSKYEEVWLDKYIRNLNTN